MLVARGLAAVTHRAVAAEAGVPLARTTYHFPTVGDLLRAIQLTLTARFDARLVALLATYREQASSAIEASCAFLEELLGERRDELLASVELAVAAVRRPDLLSMAPRTGIDVIPIITATGVEEDRARDIFAAVYGFAVIAATDADPCSASEIRRFVTATLASDHPKGSTRP